MYQVSELKTPAWSLSAIAVCSEASMVCCVLQLQTVGHEHARVIQWSRTRILLDFSNYVGAPKIEMVDK